MQLMSYVLTNMSSLKHEKNISSFVNMEPFVYFSFGLISENFHHGMVIYGCICCCRFLVKVSQSGFVSPQQS